MLAPIDAGAQSDAFNGTVIDANKWVVSSPLGTSTVTQNNALFITSDGTAGSFSTTPGLFGGGAGVGAVRKLTGDFNIQVDFGAFTPSPTPFTQAFFNIYQDAQNQLHIKRIVGGSANGIQTVFLRNGVLGQTGVTPQAISSGKFRITRSGSRITTSFNAGSGFVTHFSQLGLFTGDVVVSLMLHGPAAGPPSVFYDNYLINAGTLVPLPVLSVNDTSVAEGNVGSTPAIFTVSLSAPSGHIVTVDYATADGTANAASGDYQAASGTVTFNPGETSRTIVVQVNGDLQDEPNETFFVNLSNPIRATVADGQGQGTIIDDDPTPTVSINDVTVTEGDTGTTNAVFTASLSAASGQPVTVDFATADGTASAPADYAPNSGTLAFPPGTTTQTLTVMVQGDVLDEPDETFFVNLNNPTNALVADGQGLGTILNDDPAPTLSIDDVTVTEGDVGTTNAIFTVTLSPASGRPVTVEFATADGTASAPADYAPNAGTLTFPPGTTTQTVAVMVNGDPMFEPDETFFVNLSTPTNATLADGQGQGTILDDDAPPTSPVGKVNLGGHIDGITGELTEPSEILLQTGIGAGGKATFGGIVDRTDEALAPSGNLRYIDHVADVDLKVESFSSLLIAEASLQCPVVIGGRHAKFSGRARVNGISGQEFEVEVDDCGEPGSEPGAGPDQLKISINGPAVFYMNFGPLVGGNIQIHSSMGQATAASAASVASEKRETAVPGSFWLRTPGPNPTRSGASIRLGLPHESAALLTLHDVAGRVVRKLLDSVLPAGEHVVRWDRRNKAGQRVGAGVYFVRLAVGRQIWMRKIILL